MDDISFIAPDGGDPVAYFERTTLKIGDASPEALIEAAVFLEDQIRTRTAEGISVDGTPFIAYNSDYIKQKVKAGVAEEGLGGEQVNLIFNNNMMPSMKTRLGGGQEFEIGFFEDSRQAEKARIHNEGAYFVLEGGGELGEKIRVRFDAEKHKHIKKGFVFIPQRHFLGFNATDLDKAAEIIALHGMKDGSNPYGFSAEELAMSSENDISTKTPRRSVKKKKKSRDY